MYRHKPQHKHIEQEQLDRWLVSYADYMTLMFALFVVLYAMALLKEEPYSVLSDSLTKLFEKPSQKDSGVEGSSVLTLPAPQSEFELHGSSLQQAKGPELVADARQLSAVQQKQLGSPLVSVEQQLRRSLANLLEQGVAKIQQDENWLTIELNSGLLFASGSATATPSARVLLGEITRILAPVSNFIRVRGYTDNQPINNELFASNWELSVSRATSVLRLLEQLELAPQRMAIEGYGQYYPFTANNTAQGRAENRKVVIAVSRFGYQPDETQNTAQTESETEVLQEQLKQVAQQDGTIRVIALPGGGIRITTRDDNPEQDKPEQNKPEQQER